MREMNDIRISRTRSMPRRCDKALNSTPSQRVSFKAYDTQQPLDFHLQNHGVGAQGCVIWCPIFGDAYPDSLLDEQWSSKRTNHSS